MENTTPNKASAIALGVVGVVVGVISFLAASGVLPQAHQQPVDPAPLWMGWLIGAMFFGAGVIAIARGVWGGESDSSGNLSANAPYPLRAIQGVVSAGIACSLAVLFTWVAFGSGPRHFSVFFGLPFLKLSMPGDASGRVAFGAGAIILWCVIAALAIRMLRNSRK